MEIYNPKEIEAKWQDIWLKQASEKINKDDTQKKFYILDMFPYPSGTGLHMGHTESYTASDVFYRFKKMQGFNVLHPQGFDAFGLPAENFAIKTGVHPAETTKKNMENYIRQMQSLGFAYDFSEQAVTSDPEYYKWTQWIFSEFYKNGLVYKKTSKTNWCSSCQTVIANEQVMDGKCDRCGTEIEQKEVPTWFFKITDFAEELLADLDTVDWPEHTKKNQRNWIGKSIGAEVDFLLENSADKISVYTTRIDTIFSGTYIILAPEHYLVEKITTIENKITVEKYVIETKKKTELERIGEQKNKEGVFTGAYAINPATQEKIPVWISDFVLANYGTGSVFADAHDERDFEMAKKYDIPLKVSIRPEDENLWKKVESLDECFSEEGILINSSEFDGLTSAEARPKIIEWLAEKGLAKKMVNYRLRDWSISRQRYWGCPIPIVYSPEGVAQFVPEKYLPWTLPTDVDFVPTGVSPLAKSAELQKRTEEIFGAGWTPEYDTMDTFVDSSWYFLRYPDAHNDKEFCSQTRKKWLPVDVYIGGAEHTYMHLMYARFFVKALHKIGHIDFSEPFLKLRHQGMVLDKEGKKMSKSKGNVINPDDMVEKFGADSVRTYMLFVAPLEDAVMWNEENIVGVRRFLDRIWRLQEKIVETEDKAIESLVHKTIKKVGMDIEAMKFNTAISQMMILVNEIEKYGITKASYELFLQILAPFAPHLTEEIWAKLGHEESIFLSEWPEYDSELIKDEEINLVVQINGKVRDLLKVSADLTEEEVKKIALEREKIKMHIAGKEIRKIIYVKNKLISIVV
jgi:leucyl-tRNA synthetase